MMTQCYWREYGFVSCCFYEELKEIASDWNVHIISSSRYQGPRGRPDTMYFLPHLYNRQNLGTEMDNEEIDECILQLQSSYKIILPNFENLRVLC